ncbi:hypothetical protein Purlil1_12766 [Purpureocillium lilacinum]|uniref:Uncharacterized protein n=1 Tax=Purpureocillium lilacinum TaxID=33203 RepID=A0ABR0BFW2_PURLI|nr:hypothetical protein Purlil1_12766 [Purpureocillium lilacinum]
MQSTCSMIASSDIVSLIRKRLASPGRRRWSREGLEVAWALRGRESVAWKGKRCVEGKALRGRENVARKGKRCVEGKALRGRESVARKGRCCAEGKMLRGRESVAWKGKRCVEGKALRGRESVAWKGKRCVAWEMRVQATSCALGYGPTGVEDPSEAAYYLPDMTGASRAGMSWTWPNPYMQVQQNHAACYTQIRHILSTEPEQAYYRTSSADLPPDLPWRRDLHDFVRARRYFAAFGHWKSEEY